MDERSKVLKFVGFRWDAVDVKQYKGAGAPFKDVTRQTLLGDGRGEEPFNVITRYFEIQPGGYSTGFLCTVGRERDRPEVATQGGVKRVKR